MNRFLAVCGAVAFLAAGCTDGAAEPDYPPPEEVLGAFVDAWNARDVSTMSDLMVEPLTRPEPFFPEVVGKDVEFEVTAGDAVVTTAAAEGASPGPVVAEADYSLVYTVGGTEAPSLDGSLRMQLDGDRWSVEWDQSAMWPGFEGGDRLEVTRKWARRAPILDRDGRALAVGPAQARRYPFGATAGSTVGHIGALTRPEARESDLYEPGDLAGASGLEFAFDERLAGEPGVRLRLVDGRRAVETLLSTPPTPGRTARTTLDVRVQQAAAAAFGATTGGAAVLDPSTGDVLAVVSSGELNPANYVGAKDLHPFNRALSGLYPPGSSLKVMTGAAALETGVVKPGTRLTGPAEYKGVRNFESGEFGTLDFATAVRFSVNTAFAQIAEDLGARRLTHFARAFGFSRPPAIPLGAVSSFPRPRDEGDLMWGSIGQAQVLATPLQMATVAATMANDGRRMEPRLSLAVRPSGERVVSKKTARTMARLMEGVVQGGTGTAARIPGVRVAGKTGTAEVDVNGKRMNHAWFVAFAPAGDPQLAVAVVSELGGIGGQVAAPLARAILQATLPFAPK